MTVQKTTGKTGIPIVPGGFKSNEDEARWLEQTILLRTHGLLQMAGVNARIEPKGLYDLLLLSLNSASKRGRALNDG